MMNKAGVLTLFLICTACPSSEKKATPKVPELPVAADYKDEVEASIDATNYKAALDALASEISPGATPANTSAADQ